MDPTLYFESNFFFWILHYLLYRTLSCIFRLYYILSNKYLKILKLAYFEIEHLVKLFHFKSKLAVMHWKAFSVLFCLQFDFCLHCHFCLHMILLLHNVFFVYAVIFCLHCYFCAVMYLFVKNPTSLFTLATNCFPAEFVYILKK